MSQTAALRALVVTVFAIAIIQQPAVAAPPVEAFGNLPAARSAHLSPDGKHLAVVKPVNGRYKVVFIDLTKPAAAPYIVGMEGAVALDADWKGNDRAICYFKADLTYTYQKGVSTWIRALGVTPSTQTAVLLMNNAPSFRQNYYAGRLADIAANDPDHVYMQEVDRWDREYTLDLYRVDLATGNAQLIFRGTRDTVRYVMDGYGRVIARVDRDHDHLTDHVIIGGNEVYKYDAKGNGDFELRGGLTAGTDPQLAADRPTSSGTTGLYYWSPSGFGTALFENQSYDLDDVIHDERNERIIGVKYMDDAPKRIYFDPGMERIQATLDKAYPGQTISIVSNDDAGSAYVISTEGPRNPPVLSLYTPGNQQSNIIEEAYPSLKPFDLGEMKPYPYNARDGLNIHAYLTLPPGREAHNLPTVIFPHGGPEDRDAMSFDWWAQFMASRGYAVLQPNFRGSAGYGRSFVRAGDGEWAGKVQSDVQDGVQKLIADGIADPRRICIVGASYGGYMALAGATFSPDLYACAISYGGESALPRLFSKRTSFNSEAISVWMRRIGADVDSHKLDSASPAEFADKVKIPILLIHSDRDTNVPIEQSEIEEKALKDAGKEVEFVKLAGDDHYLEFAASRIQLLREVEKFLGAHIGDSAPKLGH